MRVSHLVGLLPLWVKEAAKDKEAIQRSVELPWRPYSSSQRVKWRVAVLAQAYDRRSFQVAADFAQCKVFVMLKSVLSPQWCARLVILSLLETNE